MPAGAALAGRAVAGPGHTREAVVGTLQRSLEVLEAQAALKNEEHQRRILDKGARKHAGLRAKFDALHQHYTRAPPGGASRCFAALASHTAQWRNQLVVLHTHWHSQGAAESRGVAGDCHHRSRGTAVGQP